MYNFDYNYGIAYTELENVMSWMMPFFIFIMFILSLTVVGGIVSYVLRGIAVYRMSANRRVENGWMGFIPFARNYQLGRLAGEIELGNRRITNTGLWLLLLPIILGAITSFGFALTFTPYITQMTLLGLGQNAYDMQAFMGAMVTFLIAELIFIFVVFIAQMIVRLFRGLALHKIFSFYHGGQRPVFFLILALFVPLAESILLFLCRDRPLLESTYAQGQNIDEPWRGYVPDGQCDEQDR